MEFYVWLYVGLAIIGLIVFLMAATSSSENNKPKAWWVVFFTVLWLPFAIWLFCAGVVEIFKRHTRL